MDKTKIDALKSAYDAVFDENGDVRACGRDACAKLISLMREFTSKNIGDEETGKLEVDTIRSECRRVLAITL